MRPPSLDFSLASQPLRLGELVVMPSDTIYGIFCSAHSQKAVERLYQVRRRDPNKPCIILIADIRALDEFGIRLSATLRPHLEESWPGKTSVVLPCPDPDWSYLHRDTGTLAFRVPDYPELQNLLQATGPLLAPSANIGSSPPAKTIDEAKAYFGAQVSLYLDGGKLEGSPSRLITFNSDGHIEVLR